jgi:hypothetical protein
MTNVFVFGSNLAGRHGKGAAKYAHEHWGAVYGEGIGRTGNAYAIKRSWCKREKEMLGYGVKDV